MKKTILKTLLLAATALTVQAYQVIDISTLTTNASHSAAYITIPGVCTNAAYTATNPASVTVGDSLPNAFVKVNTNFYQLTILVTATSNDLATANSVVAGQISGLGSAFTSVSNTVVTATNQFAAFTNHVAGILTNSGTSSASYLRLISPSGTAYYLAVDNAGTLTVTNAP